MTLRVNAKAGEPLVIVPPSNVLVGDPALTPPTFTVEVLFDRQINYFAFDSGGSTDEATYPSACTLSYGNFVPEAQILGFGGSYGGGGTSGTAGLANSVLTPLTVPSNLISLSVPIFHSPGATLELLVYGF